MLAHLRQLVQDTLAPVAAATLSTIGPAGLQARLFPCQTMGLTLYLLVPSTSDHLFNLEYQPAVVVSTAQWQLVGRGHCLGLEEAPAALTLAQTAAAKGCDLVAITPTRLQINQPCSWSYSATIDIDEVT